MAITRTTCPYCGVGCGVEASSGNADVIAVAGDDNHPANGGRLCVKGSALAETLGISGRLLQPQLQGRDTGWDEALDTLAQQLADTRERHGPESIAFYLSGQLLTEDYYVANKLMKGFLGSANVDTNSRLCMSSAVSAHKRAFGEDIVPVSYSDVECSNLVILTGSNTAWSHPVLFQRISAAKAANPDLRVVVIDTRRTPTCDIADLFLQIAPGSDGYLFGGLLNYLHTHRLTDSRYIADHTEGFDEALSAVAQLTPAQAATMTALPIHQLETFFAWFGETERVVTLFSQGINQSATGTDKCNAIINCHLATGRLGKPGAGPFSITGQPNAMGGREVGGLATQLAAHLDFTADGIDTVQRFWRATDMARQPGKMAADMFNAIEAGKIRFLWVMATNPAVSLPDTRRVRRALKNCEFVVVSDCNAQTDTTAFADLLLPATGWGEKDGTVTNSERVISRQRSLVKPPGAARPDWWIVTEVARRLGFGEAFAYERPADIFREHAALSGFENHGGRAFNISALSNLDDDAYDALEPIRWPCTGQAEETEPLGDGKFFTPSGKARFIATAPELPDARGSLVINSGRLRDQWHTMTRTGAVAKLARHRDFFTISLNPEDAARLELHDAALVELENGHGRVRGPLKLDAELPRGQAFLPIHWNAQFTGAGTANNLFPTVTDPVSGQPQSKFTRANATRIDVNSWGYLFSRNLPRLPRLSYWSRMSVAGGHLILVADQRNPEDLLQVLGLGDKHSAVYTDPGTGDFRVAQTRGDAIISAAFLHRSRALLPKQAWLAGLGGLDAVRASQVLSCSDAGMADPGALVCSCWEVGEAAIVTAIECGAHSVEALGKTLRCGTQCGSCIPELKQYLQSHQAKAVSLAS